MLNRIISYNLTKLFILSAIWGSAFMGIKIAVFSIHPISVVTIRLIIASVILTIIFKFKGYKFNFSINTYIYIFFIALFGNCIPFYLISWSEIYIDSNLAGLLLSVAPLFAIIFSHFLTNDDKFNFFKLLATIFGFIGIIILLGYDNFESLFSKEYYLIIPKLAIIVAAFGYVISSIFAYNLKDIDNIPLTTIVLIFASIMSLPFMLYYEINNFKIPEFKSLLAVIYLGIAPTAVAYLLRFHIISKAGPVFLSYVAYLIPIFALLWGFILLSEEIYLSSIVGITLILIGVYIGRKNQ